MRVLAYMTASENLTGQPRRLLSLARALRSENIQIAIASDAGSSLLEAAGIEGCRTVPLSPPKVLRGRRRTLFQGGIFRRLTVAYALWKFNLRLAGIVRQERADVIWLRGSKGIVFGALAAVISRRPLIWDLDMELPSKGLVRVIHLVGLRVASSVVFQYRMAPVEIFGSSTCHRYSHKFNSIFPGVEDFSVSDIGCYSCPSKQREDSRFVILHVGTICDRKNQMLLVEALGKVRQSNVRCDVRVRFAGGVHDQEYEHRLRCRISALGLEDSIELLGWRHDVSDLMMDSDLLALPSKDEGVPNAVQEAMLAGLPVLVSPVGGMPEIVADGVTGWIVGLDEAHAWAERISWCIEHREEVSRVGCYARCYAEKEFSLEEWGKKYAKIFRDVGGRCSRADSFLPRRKQ